MKYIHNDNRHIDNVDHSQNNTPFITNNSCSVETTAAHLKQK